MPRTKNPDATCATCAYFDRQEGGGIEEVGDGWCKRRTATIQDPGFCEKAPTMRTAYGIWLATIPEDWCGEHPEFWADEVQVDKDVVHNIVQR